MPLNLHTLFGTNYLVNMSSKEIHNLKNGHKNCNIMAIKDKRYVKRKKAIKLIDLEDYNGCRYCWKEKDEG